jgi:hypothetical protein
MYYDVEFILQIHGCFGSLSTLDAWLCKRLTLPFPPYKGLTVSIGDWSCTIDDLIEMSPSGHERKLPCQIEWILEESRFKVFLPGDKEIYWAQVAKRPHRPLAEIVDEYLANGWEKREDIS